MALHIQDNETPGNSSRRSFLRQSSALAALALTPPLVSEAARNQVEEQIASAFEKMPLRTTINGKAIQVDVEPRVTLLDLLREQLHLTGTKKGCDHGQCGACTVHIDGTRINSCLVLAVTTEGREITTIEGLESKDGLHPMQQAFIEHDAFQCGYCTPGQIMSAIACIREGHAGSPDDIREFMSGNICRCGAYSHIVDAITAVKEGGRKI